MKKQNKTTLAGYLESFFRNRLVAQLRASPATVSTYRDGLRLLLVFASKQTGKSPSQLSVEDLDRDFILAFLDHLEKERGNSIRTRNARLAVIKSFFHHVAYCDPSSIGIVQRVTAIQEKRFTRKSISYLRKEELDALLKILDRANWQGRRDYVLLLFLGRTGARVSEAININASDLRLDRPSQVLLHGKGFKERIVPLTEDLIKALSEWYQENKLRKDDDNPVFINARKQRLTRFGVTHILARAVKLVPNKLPHLASQRISPHTLRHSVAMHMLQAGVDLTTIQSWLGHVNLNTTHQYVEADTEMKRRAIEKCQTSEVQASFYEPGDDLLKLLENL